MTKTICGRGAEPAQHLGELEPGQAGHLDVEEDHVDSALVQQPQPVGRGVAGEHLADPVVLLEQEADLVESGALVVDDQRTQGADRGAHACTPGANFGTRTTTLVPAPGAVSTTSP